MDVTEEHEQGRWSGGGVFKIILGRELGESTKPSHKNVKY
jgi:ABC-type uncharacterized transport system ATPase subunit